MHNKKIYFLSDFHLGAPNAAGFYLAIGQIADYEGTNAADEVPALYKRKMTSITCNRHQKHVWLFWFGGEVTYMPKMQVAI